MSKKIICLFDVDGTLTEPLQVFTFYKNPIFCDIIFLLRYYCAIIIFIYLLIKNIYFYFLQPISPSFEKFLLETVKKDFDIAVIGGSDLNKIQKQLGSGNLFEKYKYVFAENGLIAFKNGKALPSQVNNKAVFKGNKLCTFSFNIHQILVNSKYARRGFSAGFYKFHLAIYIRAEATI